MNNIDEINAIANEIANNKQKPTVALIKGKLSNNVPLPTIIATLKHWQHDPAFTRKQIKVQKEEPKSDGATNMNEYISGEIQKAIAPLLTEIEHLKKEIALLKNAKD